MQISSVGVIVSRPLEVHVSMHMLVVLTMVIFEVTGNPPGQAIYIYIYILYYSQQALDRLF